MPLLLLQKKILRWYRIHGRDLPWRNTSDPYKILLSEIMLQQTQVSRVVDVYKKWIKQFPNFKTLAPNTRREVLIAWQGMGYNRRAIQLLSIAQVVMHKYAGKLPQTLAELLTLPGIGEYTSRSILCFAFQQRVSVIDVNVRRVLSRIFWRMKTVKDVKHEHAVRIKADSLVPARNYYDWNQALMDFGSLICSSKPKCAACPIHDHCKSFTLLSNNSIAKSKNKKATSIPRRIYRGKVIEFLRHVSQNDRTTFSIIVKHLIKEFNKSHHAWLIDIISSLEKDNLIQCYLFGNKISFATIQKHLMQLTFSLAQ